MLRTAVDDTWGGLSGLGRGQLAMLALDAASGGAFAVTHAAVHSAIDETRPMRTLVRRDAGGSADWALLFAAAPGRASLPTICRSTGGSFMYLERPEPVPGEWCAPCAYVERVGDRALVCGGDASARALRDDFLARGLGASSTQLHAEQHDESGMAPAIVVVDAEIDASTLRATVKSMPRQPVTTSVTPAALAVAARLQGSPQVEAGGPGQAMGGCVVVGHHRKTTTLSSDLDELLIPGDGGTWIARGGDPDQVAALVQVITSTTPPSALWILPALAIGKTSTARADLWWAQRAASDGHVMLTLEGHVRP